MVEKKYLVILAFLAVLAGALWGAWPRLVGLPRAQLEITRAAGQTEVFRVEVASTPEQMAKGLMFRQSLPQDAGMLFVFNPPQVVYFWMKNTLIPLDMIFFGEDGRILKIVARTTPDDPVGISSEAPAAGVIEINAGEAERRGITVGDRVAVRLRGGGITG